MNWEDILWELVQTIESAAPKAWAIALKQVKVEMFHDGMWAFIWLIPAVVSVFIARWAQKRYENSYNKTEGLDSTTIAWIVGSVVFVMIFLIPIGSLIGKALNPEYYAIKALTDLVHIGQ